MRVEQDGGRLCLIDIDPDVNAILARPVLDVESAAAHAQCGVRADDKDGAAHSRRSRGPSRRTTGGSRLDGGGDNRPALVLARLSFWANVERAHGRAAEAA